MEEKIIFEGPPSRIISFETEELPKGFALVKTSDGKENVLTSENVRWKIQKGKRIPLIRVVTYLNEKLWREESYFKISCSTHYMKRKKRLLYMPRIYKRKSDP